MRTRSSVKVITKPWLVITDLIVRHYRLWKNIRKQDKWMKISSCFFVMSHTTMPTDCLFLIFSLAIISSSTCQGKKKKKNSWTSCCFVVSHLVRVWNPILLSLPSDKCYSQMARKRRGKNGQELGWYFIEPATIWRWSLKKSKLILPRYNTHTGRRTWRHLNGGRSTDLFPEKCCWAGELDSFERFLFWSR